MCSKDSFIRGAAGVFSIDETIEIAQRCADDQSLMELFDSKPVCARRTTC